MFAHSPPHSPTLARPRTRQIVAAIGACLAILAALVTSSASAQTPAPANDRLADAVLVGGPDLLVVDTHAATIDPDEPVPSCAPPGTSPIVRTVWYHVVARGPTLRVTTAGSGASFHPILAIYRQDTAGRLSEVSCGNLWGLVAAVTAGQGYYLQVGAANLYGDDDAGRISLSVGPVADVPRSGGGSVADLAVSLADTPDPVDPGADLTVSATVLNAGPDSAAGVTLTIPVPASTTFRSVSAPAPWLCGAPGVGATGSVSCTVTNLAAATPAQIAVVVRVDAGTAGGSSITTVASIGASGSVDANPSNDTATVQTAVRAVTSGQACQPRPNVGVQVQQTGAGQLAVTIRATTNVDTPTNALQSIQITTVSNAAIDVPNGPSGAAGGITVPTQPGGQIAQFTVRRAAPGPFRADLVVTDACGPWPTFVGGGIGVP
ncbi:MAG: DUF11 domain-containing protein [Chloroflexi bacterium]|nr:DUF11 domain-containing protein [Chloroflexota bacterium]